MSRKEKKDIDEMNTQASSSTETGSAVDVEEMMRKYDRESNTRHWEGIPWQIIRFAFAAFAVLMVYMNLFANWDERVRRCLFLGTIIVFTYLMYPISKGGGKKKNHVPWYDIILMLVGAGCYYYYIFNFQTIINHATRISQQEIVIGTIGILILLEACRRVVGIPIVVVASFFICYSFYTGAALKKVVYNLFYTTSGVIGVPIGVCSTYIVLFIIFGAFLETTGISSFFINLANSLAGASTGGPAKVAVISSALCGMVSGSSVANTVTTGSITIPLMKKTGYKGEFAGAVEAAASTGGQIMPPIMGAAAFLMAEMIGVSYAEITIRAILPAVLYFLGIFLMVHLEARRLGLKGLNKKDLPKFLPLVLKQGYLLLPLVTLIYMVMKGYTLSRSAVIATFVAIAVSMFRKETRITPSGFVESLATGSKNTISVAVACGAAGIIAGVVTMTGLGQLLITTIVSIAGGVKLIALFLTMLTCIVLGMGVPTTATYIIMATTCAPILVTGMGINVIAAHMFVFYFGIVADITPPVALAAYAGSAIARANPMRTAWNATKLANAAFIVPYIFSLNPTMLFIDASPFSIVLIIVTSVIGLLGIAVGLEGYFEGDVAWPLRILAIAGGLLLIYPGIITDATGLGLCIVVFAIQYLGTIKKTAAEA